MSDTLDTRTLFKESRPRVYLLWALLTGVGYIATHFYQHPNINGVWFVLSVIGLGYMYRVMPLRVRQMRLIFMSWLIPITIGIIISGLAARTSLFPNEVVHNLGAFWLLVSAIGYAWNGAVDPPSRWYYIAAAVNILAAALVYTVGNSDEVQYIIAAVVTVWSMLSLWLFRSDA